jgi:hypothetical protein
MYIYNSPSATYIIPRLPRDRQESNSRDLGGDAPRLIKFVGSVCVCVCACVWACVGYVSECQFIENPRLADIRKVRRSSAHRAWGVSKATCRHNKCTWVIHFLNSPKCRQCLSFIEVKGFTGLNRYSRLSLVSFLPSLHSAPLLIPSAPPLHASVVFVGICLNYAPADFLRLTFCVFASQNNNSRRKPLQVSEAPGLLRKGCVG